MTTSVYATFFAHSWMAKFEKSDICTRVYSIAYARVRIDNDKPYRVDRPLCYLCLISERHSVYSKIAISSIVEIQNSSDLPKNCFGIKLS